MRGTRPERRCFFLPAAGSFIGNLIRSLPLDITFDISDEYSVEISLSSKVRIFLNPITSS